MMRAIATILLTVLISGVFFPLVLSANEVDDFRFAVGLYSDGNLPLAASELQKFIRQYPDSPFLENAKFLLANIYLSQNDYEQAKVLFEELHRSGTDPLIKPEVLLGLAQGNFFTVNLLDSYRYLTTFIKDFPRHRLAWKAHYLAGRIEFIRENYDESLAHLNQAQRLNPEWSVLIARLNTLLRLSKYEEAEQSINRHIHAGKRDENLYRMIVIYLNDRLKDKAYQTVSEFARDFIPADSQYHDDYLLVVSEAKIEQGKYEEGLETLNKMTRKTERSDYLTALSYLRTGRETNAENIFSRLSENAVNVEIRSNSYFFLAGLRGKDDISVTNRMLTRFLHDNPEHPFTGAANYQLGLNHFTLNNFGDAINHLTIAIPELDDQELEEKALYLIAESYFQLQHSARAIEKFNNYLNSYPQGAFVDEVLFKSGLHFFRQKDLPQAFVRFGRLIDEHPESERAAMANFYQGEIFTAQNQYDLAFNKYRNALEDFEDKGLIQLRLAQINFNLGNYDESLKNLDNVPDSEDFLFEKSTIKGNALFAKKDYLNSLRQFETAFNAAKIDEAKEDALIRQARTLYQLNEYREALRLYRQILELNPSESNILMAATIAFTANDYRAAIGFYTRYVEDYPEGRDFYRAKLHLADSYYNLNDYAKAADEYRRLILPAMDRDILFNSLNGLQWSANRSEDVDFELHLLNSISQDSPADFKIMLQNRLVNYYFETRRWEDVLTLARTIRESAPDDFDMRNIKVLMAKSYTNLAIYDQAEDIYRDLHSQKPEADVLYNWAEVHLLQQDSLAAITRIRQASELTVESNVWLQLLRLGVSLKDRDFLIDYERYLSIAGNVEREQAQLLWIEWQLQAGNLETARPQIDALLNSSYEPIKARAQFYRGVHLYKSGRISEAIPELLRVRYLYPRVEDVRLDAELLACYAYLEINDRENALKLFDSIKDSLPRDVRNNLRKELGLEG